MLRLAVGSATKIVLYTPSMLSEVKAFAPNLDARKVVFIRNPVDTERFKKSERAEKPYDVIYVGRINAKKGVHEIIKAIGLVKKHVESVKLLVVGDFQEKKFELQLRQLLDSFSLNNNVVFAGGVENNRLPNYYSQAKIFAYASHGGEGIPRAMLEAMACELPVVTTRVAGIRDVINASIGLEFEVGDHRTLAKQILYLIGNMEEAYAMGKSSRSFVEKNHSMEIYAHKLFNCFEEITL